MKVAANVISIYFDKTVNSHQTETIFSNFPKSNKFQFILDKLYLKKFTEICKFFSKLILKKIPKGTFTVVSVGDVDHSLEDDMIGTMEEYVVCAYKRSDSSLAAIICDKNYPQLVVKEVLLKIVHEEITDLLQTLDLMQNPSNVSKLHKTKETLEDTKGILFKSLDQMLERGESIDSLLEKTDELSDSSKLFMKNAKKMNSCWNNWCSIL